MHRPLIVAHRGASADAPENTLPAFELAWQQGADAIEGDFHLTRDRHIVCIHDTHTKRYADRKLTVRKSRLSALQQLDVGRWKADSFAGATIPTLREVMELVPPGKKLYIEIKSNPRILRHLYKILDTRPHAPDQLVVISFSSRVIKRIKRERPRYTAYLLSNLRHRYHRRLEPAPARLLALLKKTNADGLSVFAHPKVDESFVRPILESGYPIHVWTVDDPVDAKRWAALGVSSITTNRPGALRREMVDG